MTNTTAYGLPVPPVVKFSEAEQIGAELHDRWADMTGKEPPFSREDLAWADVTQFIVRRAAALAERRAA